MSKVLTDQIEKRTGGTAIDVPATGKWPEGNIADDQWAPHFRVR